MPESVLIIDDDPGIAAALTARLESLGYQVTHAAGGLAGIEAAERRRPDVILLDIRMPDIDGYEACGRIKKLPDCGDIPIICLSANAHDSARERAIDSGGAAFLSKPYEASDIVCLIERVTGQPAGNTEERRAHA